MKAWKRVAWGSFAAGCLAAVAVALGSSPAQAADYCVHAQADPCTGQIDKGADLQDAFDTAAATPDNDTVHIGPGDYVPAVGNIFDYTAGAGGEIRIIGSGTGDDGTFIKGNDGNIEYSLIVQTGAKSTVENLVIAVPNGSIGGQNVGLSIRGGNSTQTLTHVADGVRVLLPPNPTVGTGPLVGVELLNGTFRNGTISGPPSDAFATTGVSSSGNDLIEDATIKTGTAVYMQGQGTARRIDATGARGFHLVSNNGYDGTFTIEDVLWRPLAGDPGLRGLDADCQTLAGIQVTLRHATFLPKVGSGGSTSISCGPANSHANLDIHSSILSGGGKAILIGNGPDVTVDVSYSNFDPATIQAADPADVTQGPGNVNVAPNFVGADDLRLTGNNPDLLDTGDPAALAAGESTTDLADKPRIVDAFPCAAGAARRDMGAYEFEPGFCGPDTTKPTAKMLSPVPWAQLGSKTLLKWTGSDGTGSGIQSFTLARKRAPYNGNFGFINYYPAGPSTLQASASLLPGVTDCFAVRAIDNANNVGAFSPWRCTTVPMDDRALSRSAGWSLGNSSAYFNSTFTGTSSINRTLSKSGAQMKRIGLVATKCATCGTVAVKVNGTTIGMVNLFSSTTKFKQIISLPTISLRTGTVSVVTTSSGKRVYVDGLALSRQ